MGAYSLGAYSLERPIWDLRIYLPELYIEWGPAVWGPLQSRTTDFGSDRPFTCALQRAGAYSLWAYNLERPILDLMIHRAVLYLE